MVIDKLSNASCYYGLGRYFETALQYLAQTDFTNMEPGKYDVDGDNVYASVQRYTTAPVDMCKAEGHANYADIQYVFSGQEKMGYENITNAVHTGETIPEIDIAFYQPLEQYVKLEKGTFAIVWPQDIHTPRCILGQPEDVVKVVVKVKV